MIRIMKYGEVANEDIFARSAPEVDVAAVVSGIIADVRARGDEALFDYCEKFDHIRLSGLEVTAGELEEAMDLVEPEFIRTLELAAANIRQFHEKQVRQSFILTREKGVVMGQRVLPLDRVGLYVPGGTAAYPSTVLMDAIPAKIAGCPELFITTPPGRDGKVNPAILAAARVAGVDRVFKVGGAQAVAALAYGTRTVPRVDRIVGPGNAFVAEGKRQVFGRVAIDMIAGPSEILIVADGKSDPRHVAADMLSQAEHDRLSSAVLVTDSIALAEAVRDEIERQVRKLLREEIASASIDKNGKIIVAPDIRQAVEISNAIAPEHLELCLDNPFDYLDSVRHAGSIFMGRSCPEALGDYLAGPNHTLPTSGSARFYSPLSVDDFVKKSQYTYFTREALAEVSDAIQLFAEKEGLSGHARSVRARFEEDEP